MYIVIAGVAYLWASRGSSASTPQYQVQSKDESHADIGDVWRQVVDGLARGSEHQISVLLCQTDR